MFEPEIRDASTVERWGIVRTHRRQTIAEHSFYVALYATEIARWLHPENYAFQAAVSQFALWHDLRDEIFTGDIPGPAKRRAIVDKQAYDNAVASWSRMIFGSDPKRFGEWHEWSEELKCVVKIADELDQVFEMSCELRMGNMNVRKIITDALDRALKWVDELFDGDPRGMELKSEIQIAAQTHIENDPRTPYVFTLRSA